MSRQLLFKKKKTAEKLVSCEFDIHLFGVFDVLKLKSLQQAACEIDTSIFFANTMEEEVRAKWKHNE